MSQRCTMDVRRNCLLATVASDHKAIGITYPANFRPWITDEPQTLMYGCYLVFVDFHYVVHASCHKEAEGWMGMRRPPLRLLDPFVDCSVNRSITRLQQVRALVVWTRSDFHEIAASTPYNLNARSASAVVKFLAGICIQ